MTSTGWSLRRRGSFLLALALGLVVLADWLFYGQPVGWTASVFGFALLAALTLRGGRYLRSWPGRLVAAATVGLILALVIHPGVLAVGLGLLGLVTLAIIDRGGWTSSVAEWASRWGMFLGHGLTQVFHDAALRGRWFKNHAARGAGSRALTLAWAVPIGLSAVFAGLFALANPVVSRWLSDAMTRLADWTSGWSAGRITLWLVTGAAAWALVRVRLRARRPALSPPPEARVLARIERATGTPLVVRCLVLFNAVFAVQTLLDVRYLYGGAALPDGMTYAQYAHRGAYPLVATALLAGLFVLLTFRPGGAAQRSAWARRLVGLWIAQNIVLMASAVRRLGLYVEAYSLTRWRLAAAIWMVLVGVGFAWLIWRIVAGRDNRWLLQRVTLTAAAVLYAVCFINLDGAIARYNVAHCAELGGEGQTLDLAYLERLGPAALPALRDYLEATKDQPPAPPPPTDTYRWSWEDPPSAKQVARTLQRQLDDRLDNWRSWTWRRAQIATELELVATR